MAQIIQIITGTFVFFLIFSSSVDCPSSVSLSYKPVKLRGPFPADESEFETLFSANELSSKEKSSRELSSNEFKSKGLSSSSKGFSSKSSRKSEFSFSFSSDIVPKSLSKYFPESLSSIVVSNSFSKSLFSREFSVSKKFSGISSISSDT